MEFIFLNISYIKNGCAHKFMRGIIADAVNVFAIYSLRLLAIVRPTYEYNEIP